jgi:hypothetical protein
MDALKTIAKSNISMETMDDLKEFIEEYGVSGGGCPAWWWNIQERHQKLNPIRSQPGGCHSLHVNA